MQAIVDQVLVQYTDTGKGPVLLCVHGWMHDAGTFKQLTDSLSEKYRVVALDLPNFGKSQITIDLITLKDYATFLQSFVQKLGITDYTYIGHSMGGQIGMYGVGSKLLDPSRLILIASSGIRDTRRFSKLFMKSMSVVFGRITPKRLKAKFYNAIGSDYNPDLSDVHKKIIAQTLQADVQEIAKEITVPTLLIYGSDDTSTPVWMGKKLARLIAGSELTIIDGGNHWLHQTNSEKVAPVMRKFLEK